MLCRFLLSQWYCVLLLSFVLLVIIVLPGLRIRFLVCLVIIKMFNAKYMQRLSCWFILSGLWYYFNPSLALLEPIVYKIPDIACEYLCPNGTFYNMTGLKIIIEMFAMYSGILLFWCWLDPTCEPCAAGIIVLEMPHLQLLLVIEQAIFVLLVIIVFWHSSSYCL